MEEFFKKLRPFFSSEVVIKVFQHPPSYISNIQISSQKDPIIFIYKERRHQQIRLAVNSEFSNATGLENTIADLSITGQPLECPFDNEDFTLDDTVMVKDTNDPEDHYYEPVSLTEARKCVSFINLKMHPPLPVWILTDAADKKRTFLFGVHIKGNWNTGIWAMSPYLIQTEKVPIKDMIADFEHTFSLSNGDYKRKSAVSCLFDIKDEPGIAKHSKCCLEVNWQQPSYQVPIAQAETFLIIECNVGQEQSQVSRWWQQLLLMQKYLEIIKQRKQSCQLQITYQRDSIQLPSFRTSAKKDVPLATRVQKLLKVSDSMSVCRQYASQKDASALNATIQHLLSDNLQKGQDVTDRLWGLLIEAETYQELAENFQLILREVRTNSINPYVFAKNKTRLASLLRNIKTSSDIELMLEPLELMVEIGIEKLKRDYIFIFMSCRLASVDSLSMPKLSSFSEVGSSQWLEAVEVHMQWLAQTHTVLELVSVIHSGLCHSTLLQVTSQALTTFVQPTGSPVPSLLHLINNHLYHLRAPILTSDVCNFIDGDRIFKKWMLKLSAENDYTAFSSTYILLEESIFPQQVMYQLQNQFLADSANLTLNKSEGGLQETYSYIQLCTGSNLLPPTKHKLFVNVES